MVRPATRILGLAVVLALAFLATPSEAGARGKLIRVAVVGDSVQEAYSLQDWRKHGLVPTLREALSPNPFAKGAEGFVAAHPERFALTGQWLRLGYGFGQAGPFGASGYGLETTDAAATARIRVGERSVDVLFWRGPGGGTFTVRSGGRTWRIATRAARADGGGIRRLRLPRPGTLEVRGPAGGGLVRFLGVRERRPVRTDRDQVEVSHLAHGGRRTGEDVTRANRQAFAALDFDVTLLMSGTTDALTSDFVGGARWLRDFEGGLRLRARTARRTGACVVVPLPPLPIDGAIQRRYHRVSARVARAEGCAFAPALRGIWPSARASQRAGLTEEGVHPTPKGYRRVSRALFPVIKAVTRDQRRAARLSTPLPLSSVDSAAEQPTLPASSAATPIARAEG